MKNFSTTKLHSKMALDYPLLRWDFTKDFYEHRQECEEKLRELLGLDTLEKCPDDFTIVTEDKIQGKRHVHFLVQTEKGYYVNCHLLLPREEKEKMPLCLCMQGHVSGAHLSLGVYKFPYDEVYLSEEEGLQFAVQATDRGYAALALELRGFGANSDNENGCGTSCEQAAMGAMLLGRTLIGERVWDIQRVLDSALNHFDFITMENSILMGESGGGTVTYYAACLEDRFSVYVPIVALCDYKSSIFDLNHCKCNYIPHIAKYFDMGDLAILISPKKLVVASATQDKWFPIEGAKREFERIERIYSALGCKDRCRMVIQNSGHCFRPDEGWDAILEILKQ